MADHSRNRRDHGVESEKFSDLKLSEVHEQLLREKGEPEEGYAGLPTFFLILFAGIAMACAGAWYITSHSAGFDGTRSSWKKEEVVVATGPKPVEKSIKDGEKLFNNNCASCHQVDGAGVPGAFPPLAGSPWVHGTPERIVKIAHYGISGEIEVLGKKFNGAMPNIAETMSDQKLADIATYVRQAWGNKAAPVDVDTVKAIRAAAGKRTSYTPAELLAEHPLEK